MDEKFLDMTSDVDDFLRDYLKTCAGEHKRLGEQLETEKKKANPVKRPKTNHVTNVDS